MNLSRFKYYICKNRNDFTYDEYCDYFLRKMKYYGKNLNCTKFDELIKNLYYKNDDDYNDWYISLSKVDFKFVSENIDIITLFSRSDKVSFQKNNETISGCSSILLDELKVLMSVRYRIIEQQVPVFVSKSEVMNNLDLETELTDILEKLNSKNSPIVLKAKEQYISKLGYIKENNYLADLYDKLFANLEKDIYEFLKEKINKLTSFKELILDDYITERAIINEDKTVKRKRVYCKKYIF